MVAFWREFLRKIIPEKPALFEKVRRLQKIYAWTDQSTCSFQGRSGLKCPMDCGDCCTTSYVETNTLEMLPLALEMIRRGEGEAWHQLADSQELPGKCIFYRPKSDDLKKGRCSVYRWRPLVCRMFAFSGNRDKNGHPRLMACGVMKQAFPQSVEKAGAAVDSGRMALPIMADWFMQAASIDPELARERLPINEAFRKALERVWLVERYQGNQK